MITQQAAYAGIRLGNSYMKEVMDDRVWVRNIGRNSIELSGILLDKLLYGLAKMNE